MSFPHRGNPARRSALAFVLLLLLVGALGGVAVSPAVADDPKTTEISIPAVFDKAAPESVEDLKAIQAHVRKVLDKVIPCTVGVRIGAAQGSGVIVSKDGYVLTAGHVSGTPGKDCTLVLPDGKTVKGKTLGVNRGIDSGMIKITEEREWPYVEMGKSVDLKAGQWCIATGHPGGYKTGRSPVVRLGRILTPGKTAITTDCTLVGGDSGGPLFDMHGRVIGIHSRIGGSITANVHVPVDTYSETWDRLVKGESIGGTPFVNTTDAWLGVQADLDAKTCVLSQIVKDSPAEKAGLKAMDVVLKFDGQKIDTFDDLSGLIKKKKPGDEVSLEVKRGDEKITLKVTLGKRG
jgi:serine protease Do